MTEEGLPDKCFQPQVAWDPEVETYLRGALGDERFERTAAALCRPPCSTCLRVNTLAISPEEVVAHVRSQLPPGAPPDAVRVHPQVPCAVLMTGSGPHEVCYRAAGGKEVIVSRKTGEAVLRGAPVYAPGVLAVSSGVARGELVALSMCLERPGSDTPEVARGTTLYDTVPPGGAGPEPSAAAAVADEEEDEAAASGSDRECEAVEGGGGAVGEGGGGAVEEGGGGAVGEGGGGGAGGPAAGQQGAGQQGAHARKRTRARRRERHGPVEGAGEGEQGAEAAGQEGRGWTRSSRGPVAPRTGRYIGLARTAMSRQEMFRNSTGLALQLEAPVFRVPQGAAGLEGRVMLQNLPSVVAALVLAPPPGSTVLDMCAAPGGKTTLLAQLMGGVGKVVAFDRTHTKVRDIESLAAELGVAACVAATKADAGRAVLPPQRAVEAAAGGAAGGAAGAGVQAVGAAEAEATTAGGAAGGAAAPGSGAAAAAACGMSDKARKRDERRRAAMLQRGIAPPVEGPSAASASVPAQYPPESFDHVLLDAPCSALGLRPRLQQQGTALYLRQCAAAQRRLADAAVALLRVGGSLVYSTCTVNPGENEAVVRYVLDKYGGCMRLVRAGPPFLGGPGLVGCHPTMTEAGLPIAAAGGAGVEEEGAGAGGGTGASGAAAGTAGTGEGPEGGGGGDGPQGGAQGTRAARHSSFRGEAWLSEAEAEMVQRFDPSDPQLDTIGFFVAKFVKYMPGGAAV